MRHIRGRTAGFVVPLLLSISLAISWAAQARTFRESHILFGHLGGQGGTRTAPSGFKFGLGYNYRFSETLWLDISAGIAIGSLPCYTRTRFETQCGGFGGTQVEGL